MIEELKTFITVVEVKNFTKAAEQLNLSQPSVSNHIKNLENYFGVTLINRSVKQKSIFITERGYILYKKAKEIVSLLETTYMEIQNKSDSIKGSIKVGASLTIGEYVLPDFLAYFSKKYPDIDIEIVIENTATICNELKDVILDVGLIEGTSSSSSFEQEYFSKDEMVLAFPYNNNIMGEKFSFGKLQNQRWIAREEGSGTREFLNMFLGVNELTPENIMILGSNYAVKEAVKNNLGITIISKLVAAPAVENKEIHTIDLGENYIRHFSYILPKHITTSKATQIFLEELKEYSRM